MRPIWVRGIAGLHLYMPAALGRSRLEGRPQFAVLLGRFPARCCHSWSAQRAAGHRPLRQSCVSSTRLFQIRQSHMPLSLIMPVAAVIRLYPYCCTVDHISLNASCSLQCNIAPELREMSTSTGDQRESPVNPTQRNMGVTSQHCH